MKIKMVPRLVFISTMLLTSLLFIDVVFGFHSGVNNQFQTPISVCQYDLLYPILSSTKSRHQRMYLRQIRQQLLSLPFVANRFHVNTMTGLLMATAGNNKKSSSNKNKKIATTVIGRKGFGTNTISKDLFKKLDIVVEESYNTKTFYNALDMNGANDNLKRTSLGYFPLLLSSSTTNQNNKENGMDHVDDLQIIEPNVTTSSSKTTKNMLRGVVALNDIIKGNDIITIPYEIAINLGKEGDDPTIPAIQFLKHYCIVMNDNNNQNTLFQKAYYQMLPSIHDDDCYGCTDFYTDETLKELQSPYIVKETLQRRQRVIDQYRNVIENNIDFPLWNITTNECVTIKHLHWAVWIITSRVLTVQGSQDSNDSYRLLIPYLDMCNHDRSSNHVLTGRAINDGTLRVIAGTTVKAGTQINIAYGGGVAGNDRFIQDYGFLDTNPIAYDIVIEQILKTTRTSRPQEGNKGFSIQDRNDAIESLNQTTIEYDENLLASMNHETESSMRSAIQYRIGIKKALIRYYASK